MDVYSFGVLLCEMNLQEQPEMSVAGRAEQAKMVQWVPLAQLIKECIAHLPKDRPTIAWVMEKLMPILARGDSYQLVHCFTALGLAQPEGTHQFLSALTFVRYTLASTNIHEDTDTL